MSNNDIILLYNGFIIVSAPCTRYFMGVHAVCPPIFPAYIYYVYHIDIIYKKYVLTEINWKLKFSSFRMKLILMELRTIYGIYRVSTR